MVQKKRALDPDVLRRFSCFASFSKARLKKIAETAPKATFKANTVVFRQGDPAMAMFLILKGGAKIERADMDRETVDVSDASEYHVFGELSMLGGEVCRVTVTTTVDSEFLVINRKMMLDIIRDSSAKEILGIFSILSKQMWDANDREFQRALSHKTMAAQMEVEKQRALTQMVAGVAHEINTPLSIINTAVGIMARELAVPAEITIQRAADIAESLELIRRNVERAHQLVQDFKKVSVSQLIAEKETLNISEVVEETISLLVVSLKRNKIAVKFQDKLNADQKKWVGYRGFLSQILINFLSNAERYAYPNEVGGVIDVILEFMEGDQYRIVVCDHGKGIPEENIPYIFEPFFTTGRVVGGSGLGLAIVHNLAVNALKGDVSVKSKPGEGAEFTIIFPRVIPE